MRVEFFMTDKHKKILKEAIDREFAKFAQKTTYALFDSFVQYTPMWSGKTIRSFNMSRKTPQAISNGQGTRGHPGTNSMAIGIEPGRGGAEAVAYRHRLPESEFKNPYTTYYVTNGANLDSWVDSELEQEGSRLWYQTESVIAKYNILTEEYSYKPRLSSDYYEVVKKTAIDQFS